MTHTKSTSYQYHKFKSICKSIGIVIVTVILVVLGKLIIRLIPSLYANFIEVTNLLNEVIGALYVLINTLVYLVVGGGIALATKNYQRIGLIIGIVLIILISISTYLFNPAVEYYQLIDKISIEQKLTNKDAKTMTDSLLNNEVGHSGFLGYYMYTAKTYKEWIKRIFYFMLSIFWVIVAFVVVREEIN